MFSKRIPLVDLVELCRVLRHQLGAGLTIHFVLQKQAEKGRPAVRRIAARMCDAVQAGNSLSSAVDDEHDAFPLLFRSMVKLGEATGHSAEVFGELERYYELELQLRRQFRSRTILPIFQFFFAVAIIAGVIIIVGTFNPGQKLFTVFGLGGVAGALAFVGVVLGTLAALGVLYFSIARLGRQKAWMDRLLLRLPVLGPCLDAIVMSRLTLALQLTLDSGLPITKALSLSLDASGNAYFDSYSDTIVKALKNGKPLHEALAGTGLFTPDFLNMVESSEASGSVPEMMRHLTQQYQEEATRKMRMLTTVAGGAVWCLVAAFIIWHIFKLAFIYFHMFDAFKR